MTSAMHAPSAADMQSGQSRARTGLWSLIAMIFVGLLVAAAFQLPDPMIRHDDYPALLADPTLYYMKTLTEGRWLNHLWHLRGWATPAWVNYLAYQACWAIYLGCLVHNAFGREAEVWQRLMVGLIAGLSLPWVLISLWFNTLLPGMAVLALYAVLATRLSERSCRWLMVLFVPVTLMAYTTYPFLILALSLTRAGVARSARDLAALVGVFIGSFALGMLAIYTLNYGVHGVFGVPMAEWRNPSPVRDLPSALANAQIAGQYLVNLAYKGSFANVMLMFAQGAVLGAAIWMVGRQDKWRVLYLLTGMALGLGLILLQVFKTGIDMPLRSGGFVWAYLAVLFGLFVITLRDRGQARLGRNLLFTITACYMVFAGLTHYFNAAWPRLSQTIAAELKTAQGPVYVTGTYLSLDAAVKSDLQKTHSVAFRLNLLTGREIVMCESAPQDCAALPPELLAGLLGQTAKNAYEVRQVEGGSVLMLSATPLRAGKLETTAEPQQQG